VRKDIRNKEAETREIEPEKQLSSAKQGMKCIIMRTDSPTMGGCGPRPSHQKNRRGAQEKITITRGNRTPRFQIRLLEPRGGRESKIEGKRGRNGLKGSWLSGLLKGGPDRREGSSGQKGIEKSSNKKKKARGEEPKQQHGGEERYLSDLHCYFKGENSKEDADERNATEESEEKKSRSKAR